MNEHVKFLDSMENRLSKMAYLFRVSRVTEANNRFVNEISAFDELSQIFIGLGLDVDLLTELLRLMTEQLDQEDYMALADTLDYEMKPVVIELRKVLEANYE